VRLFIVSFKYITTTGYITGKRQGAKRDDVVPLCFRVEQSNYLSIRLLTIVCERFNRVPPLERFFILSSGNSI
jgi:hypothetical protein